MALNKASKAAMKKLHKEAYNHLSDDIAGYKKQRKHLKKEIKEDKDLQKKIKGTKNGKKACCEDCKRRKSCSGKRKATRRN